MKRVLLLITIFLFGVGGGFLATFLLRDTSEQAVQGEIEDLQEEVKIGVENGTLVNPEFEPDEKDPYWQFAKMGVLKVDLTKLKQKNPDVRGWVQIGGTNIDYPFVQEKNSEKGFYEEHSFNREKSRAGWIYLAAGAAKDFSAMNNVLYGGGEAPNALFDELANLTTGGWLTDRVHFVIKTYTDENQTGQIWEVFSIYKAQRGGGAEDYTGTDYQAMIARSEYNFGAEPMEEDRIITIVTPAEGGTRAVMHAKLIKQGN